ncbi:MAG: nascent polypeptide-associated complex protein [Candidatus Aenigmatarchaeota archaeon]
MMPNLNPKQMQKMMKKMGLKTEEIDAEEVIIKGKSKELVITNPDVTKMDIQGQEMFQVQGDVTEKEKEKFSDEDLQMIIDQTDCSKKEAKEALQETDDIAQAIMELKK